MQALNHALLILHLVGLVLGLSVPIANIAMAGLIEAAAPAEKPVLARFPPVMSRIGRIGLTLMWITGLSLVYTQWSGFSHMPWQFDVKLAAVIVLTALVTWIYFLEQQVKRGDTAATARILVVGKTAAAFALLAIIFAVLAFG